MFLKYFGYLIVLVLMRMIYKFCKMMSIVWGLKKQGVRFVGMVPHLQDPMRLYKYMKKYPAEYFFSRMI